jgi:hypothetical protein
MTSLDYAEDLHVLWEQYKRQEGDRPAAANETLRNIVAHCEMAIKNGADREYFEFHATRARTILNF